MANSMKFEVVMEKGDKGYATIDANGKGTLIMEDGRKGWLEPNAARPPRRSITDVNTTNPTASDLARMVFTDDFTETPGTYVVVQERYTDVSIELYLEEGEIFELLGTVSGLGYIVLRYDDLMFIPSHLVELVKSYSVNELGAIVGSQTDVLKKCKWLEVNLEYALGMGTNALLYIQDDNMEKPLPAIFFDAGAIHLAYVGSKVIRIRDAWKAKFWVPVLVTEKCLEQG